MQALLVVDVQKDFCPGGALPVRSGHSIVPVVNRLIGEHAHVILTQDWHPADHSSFATQHARRDPFDTVKMSYGDQTLWPDHCVQGSEGAEFHEGLDWRKAELVLRKGYRRHVDSYSAFFENDRETPTGLGGYLRERGFTGVILAGLATDYCVSYSALDARRLGFEATIVECACGAIDLAGSLDAMRQLWSQAGVKVT